MPNPILELEVEGVPADEQTIERNFMEYQETRASQYRDLYDRFNYLSKSGDSASDLNAVSQQLDYIESQFVDFGGTLICAPQFAELNSHLLEAA